MKFSHKFRKFLAFSECLSHFSAKSQYILSFPDNFCEIPGKFHQNFAEKSQNSLKNAEKIQKIKHFGKNLDGFSLKFWDLNGAKVWKSCRSRKTWKNEYLVAIVAVDTAENEPLKVAQTPNSQKEFDSLKIAQLPYLVPPRMKNGPFMSPTYAHKSPLDHQPL